MRLLDGISDRLGQDLRDSLRGLRQAPVFAGVAILSLALGIGANTAVFSLVNTVMLKMLPVREPERLVHVRVDGNDAGTNPIWEALRDRQQAFDGMFAWCGATFDENAGGEVRNLRGLFTSGATFDVLGVTPLLGRTWRADDDRRGGGADGPVAILSYAFWRDRYGASPDVLGRTIRLDGQPFTIVGVTPPGFFGLEVGTTFDVAVPLATEALVRGKDSALDERLSWWLRIMGRLKPGQTAAQAQVALQAVHAAVREATMPPQYTPASQAKYLVDAFEVRPASTGLSGSRVKYSLALWWLMAAVALVLLLTCANLANLSLARAAARERELAVKLAIGAPRARLVRQLLLESLLLAAAGSALGLLLAQWAARLLVRALSTSRLPMVLDLSLDARVLAFTTGVAVLASLLCGLAPAFRSTRVSANLALRAGARTIAGGWRRLGLEPLLVAAQIAVSLVLVFGAGLFVRSFGALLHVDAGFDPRQMVVAQVNARRVEMPPDQRAAFYNRLLDAARAVPDVRSATYTQFAPLFGSNSSTVVDVPGFVASSPRDRNVWVHRIADGYFAAIGAPLRAGREFTRDDDARGRLVAIVNETFVRKFMRGSEGAAVATVVGRTFRQDLSFLKKNDREPIEIVGVAKDVKYSDLRQDVPPTVYFPFAQQGIASTTVRLLVRARGDESRLAPALTAALTAVDPRVSVDVQAVDTRIEDTLIQERLLAALSGFFGLLALLVAGIGLYGMLSLAVARRRTELGVRLALGAVPARIVHLVVRDVALVTVLGLAVGLTLALVTSKLIATLLFGLTPTDPRTAALATGLLLAVAALATWLPARRASRLDPMVALRQE